MIITTLTVIKSLTPFVNALSLMSVTFNIIRYPFSENKKARDRSKASIKNGLVCLATINSLNLIFKAIK